jgi:thioredoxin reductase (NADPH)
MEHARVLIVGSGPAGYTAGIYASRAELEPVLLAGLQFGGQLMLTTEVENFPGFPEGITGQKQAERFGTRVIMEDATGIDLSQRPFQVRTDERAFSADALILATGAEARWLGLASEKRLQNLGVSACATCDVTGRSTGTRRWRSSAAETPQWKRRCFSPATPPR